MQAVVDAAFEHGATFFDTADTYGLGASEELLGQALRVRRDDVVIATKFGMDMQGRNGDDGGRRGSAAYVRTAVEASLRRLGTDHIDLYQLHVPDPQTPIEETLEALNELVKEGKVRAIGSSNLQAWQLVDADWTSRTTRPGVVRHGAERVLALQPHCRGRADPGLPRARRRRAAVLPARLRPADRQVPAG